MSNDSKQTSGLGFVGQSVVRVEDDRLLKGEGTFVADVSPAGVRHAAFLRSPYAHARIDNIDVEAARKAPGVLTVFTGAEINALTNPFPPFLMLPGMYTPLYWCMSEDKVRHIGDPVALVIADSRYEAEDALELIEVEYTPLDPVASIGQALNPASEQLWELADGNTLFDETRSYGDVDSVFASADRVITEHFSCHRQSNQPMETRGSVVEVEAGTGQLTIHNATQSSHLLRWIIAALTDKQPVGRSLKALAKNKERREAFMAGAKEFVAANKESLDRQDNSGAIAQIKRDRSLLGHLQRMGLGLLAQETFPTVKARDIGGGFGSKGSIAREDVALAVAAMELGRSVKWIEDRTENLTDGGQAREEDLSMSVAFDNDGTLRGMRVDLTVDQGAYPAFPVGAAFVTQLFRVMFPGSYKLDAFEIRNRIVATNKGKYVAYRGPWANETWVRERMIDIVSRALRRNPALVRLQNMIGEGDLPTTMITGPTIDETMSTKKTLERALEVVDLDAFEAKRHAAREQGRHLGIGFACYHEAAPGPPNYVDSINPGTDIVANEDARATIEADGSIVVYTPQMPHGQSHETTYAQVVADELGVPMDAVQVVWGDTTRTPWSFIGTGGSRGGPLGAGAIKYASREVRTQLADKAAEMLEADPADIEISDGNVHVAGVPSKGLSFAEIAEATTTDDGPAFSYTKSYVGKGDGGWSCATHVCFVDVDLETGKVQIPRYVVVEDCGPVINPAIVDGQVRGGVAQGIGAVLYENSAYDEAGNPQATTYMDYLIPTSMEIPDIELHHIETLSPGENDFRGVGEGGMIGAPAAITNAVEDALAHLGARVTDQYLPPTRILELAGVIRPDV
ncbi:MAG: xanthine dehydrogenase family protein molybdopterin-binding subunit [Acidimicrobiales bacterium]